MNEKTKKDRELTDEERYQIYLCVLKKWESINGKLEDPSIIPYEIQELNPFKDN